VYEEEGIGDCVILIHGLGGDHREWMLQMPEFSKKFRCIAIDLPGHGKSTMPRDIYRPIDHATKIYRFIKELQVDKAHIVGLSMGGMIAQELALNFGNIINKLVLVSTSARVPPGSTEKIRRWIKLYLEEGFEAFFEAEIKDIFTEEFLKENEWVIPLLKEMWKDRSFDTIIWAARGLENWDVTDKISMIESPTLIIHGGRDTLVPVAEAYLIHQGIGGSKLLVYENTGHALIGEEAERFNTDVLNFLSQ
jgi:pimeloyl-ACP methyl ester carboxylesterase